MLILTRRAREAIIIGDDIIITVLGIKGQQARLGIRASKKFSVKRGETCQQFQIKEAKGDINNNVNID